MSDVIPTGTTRDSAYLFEQMTAVTLALATPPRGGSVLDVASGFGQDSLALAAQGARVVGAEPSARMVGWARLQGGSAPAPPRYVRGWSDALPFADASFDAVFCKGAIDHFDRPELAIAEMARVARPAGRVVLAIANFGSLACRLACAVDDVREGWLGRPIRRGRRHYDVPADHFTRYDLAAMRAQAGRHLELDVVQGLSLAWGLRSWTRLVERLPEAAAARVLATAGALARHLPRYADVVVLAGRPRAARRSASTSR